jgi:hypothetical protein
MFMQRAREVSSADPSSSTLSQQGVYCSLERLGPPLSSLSANAIESGLSHVVSEVIVGGETSHPREKRVGAGRRHDESALTVDEAIANLARGGRTDDGKPRRHRLLYDMTEWVSEGREHEHVRSRVHSRKVVALSKPSKNNVAQMLVPAPLTEVVFIDAVAYEQETERLRCLALKICKGG